MLPLIYFIARCKLLCNVCFVYLCKTCNYEGQCHEILRHLPSVCAKMLGVAVVKADCSGVGVKFLYLRSIWYKQNMANSVFRLHTQGEILALLQSKPDSLLLSVSTIVSLLSQLFIFLNFEKTYDICILATIIIFNKFSTFAKSSHSQRQSRNSQRLTVVKGAEVSRAKTTKVISHSGQNVLKNSVGFFFLQM